MALLYSFAVWTSLIQLALMPFLLWACGRWFVKTSKSSGAKEELKKEKSKAAPTKRLEPLSCVSCGAALAFGGEKLVCAHCGAVTDAPKDYLEVFQFRREAVAQVREASLYIRRAVWMTSRLVKWFLVLAGFWFSATPFIMLVLSETDKRYDPLYEKLGPVVYLVFPSFLLWIIVLFFTAGMLTRIRRTAPRVSDWGKIGAAEQITCPTCGGGVQFQSGDLAALCGFCGVETLRPQVVWEARGAAASDADTSRASLIDARAAIQAAIDDLIGTPAILVFIFVILPLIFAIPYGIYLAFQEWPLATLGALTGVGLLVWAVVFFVRRRRQG